MEKIIEHLWIPNFSGFYNTLWEPYDEDYELSQVFPDVENIDDLEFNNDDYERAVASRLKYMIQEDLENILGVELELYNERIESPSYYNFYNDKLIVDFKVKDFDSFVSAVNKFVMEHREYFEKQIKAKFTPCDGWIPFYPSDLQEWDIWNEEDTIELSSIIQYILDYGHSEEYGYEYTLYEFSDVSSLDFYTLKEEKND